MAEWHRRCFIKSRPSLGAVPPYLGPPQLAASLFSAASNEERAAVAGVGLLRAGCPDGPHAAPALLLDCPSRRPGLNSLGPACPSSSSPNGTPGKKPPAPSVKLRLSRTPLEQRSGSKSLAPSAQRRSTVRKEMMGPKLVSAPNRFRVVVAGTRTLDDAAAARSAISSHPQW